MKNLSVSKKVYSDISERVNTALSAYESSAEEAMRIVDSYLDGETPVSGDDIAMLAFNMVKVELDRAMVRSKRARERAQKRKTADKTAVSAAPSKTVAEMIEELGSLCKTAGDADSESDPGEFIAPLTRGERRAMERAMNRKPKKWKRIG